MRGKVLLGCVAFIVLAAAEARDSLVAQGTARTVNVDVRVDCLAGRGVSFSLTPWTIDVAPGDSINWRLDQGANVTEMQIISKMPGNQWPFRRKPPYRSTKARPAGAQSLDNAQSALDAAKLVAPISGTVTALDLSIGEQVDTDSIKVHA